MRSAGKFIFVGALLLGAAGCATDSRYETDINSLNARISSQQGQLAAKDEELTRLQSQLNDERNARQAALAQAESEKQALSKKLDEAMAAKTAATKVEVPPAKAQESDLK